MVHQQLFILYEHASGYSLFALNEIEEIGMLLPQVEESIRDVSKFQSMVRLVAFQPFQTGANALDNTNCVSEGVIHDDLKTFLETNVPAATKKTPVIVGVGDQKMGASIFENLGVNCQTGGVVPEILRGLRCHFCAFVKGLTVLAEGKAQLGLGHSYSRCKVKFNVNRADNMIIQSIALLDQLDKDVNTFSMRIREWYGYHFPELVKIVNDNYLYAKMVKLIQNRLNLNEDMLESMEEVLGDSAKAQAVLDASRSSMGMDISEIDLLNIEIFAKKVVALAEYRKSLHKYLLGKMTDIAPNLATLVGEQVGARLISHAGSLTNLAKYPASTVQILGAEKALFRALKTKGNTPKYGLIFHSTFIGRAATKNKGRISRYLANKCSLASRIDCFSDESNNVFGEMLREQVEQRLAFYDSGEAPRKNIDVMKEAVEKSAVHTAEQKRLRKQRKKEKKLRRKEAKEAEEGGLGSDGGAAPVEEEAEVEPEKKKKKKKKDKEEEEVVVQEVAEVVTPKSEKKRQKRRAAEAEELIADADPTQTKKGKKSRKLQ